MARTVWALGAIVATGAAALAVSASSPEGTAEAAKARPNVVLIMTDDQTVEDMSVMSRTRRVLGDRGTTFSRSFVSYPLCCPSRATTQTGRYSHNHGVQGNTPPQGGYGRLDKANALARLAPAHAGYTTTHIGKFLNGYGRDAPADVPPGWTEWRGSVDPSTYRMWGYTLNENGTLNTYGRPNVQNPALYQHDVYRAKAEDFIRRRSGPGKPFFLSVAFLGPHTEAARTAEGQGQPAPGAAPPRPVRQQAAASFARVQRGRRERQAARLPQPVPARTRPRSGGSPSTTGLAKSPCCPSTRPCRASLTRCGARMSWTTPT